MTMTRTKAAQRIHRHRRVRSRVRGTAARPRLSVHRSARHITAQLIDDRAQKTLVAAGDYDVRDKVEGAMAKAAAVGKLLAERAKNAGITAAVFDRGGYRYHGRVAALADAARTNGLQF